MTKKNTTAKIAAIIALIAIFSSIVGTGALMIIGTYFSDDNKENVTEVKDKSVEELFKKYSGSGSDIITTSNSGSEITLTGETINLTGTTN